MKVDYKYLIGFGIRYGKFENTVVLFGSLMQGLYFHIYEQNLIDKFVVLYQNNILVYSEYEAQHTDYMCTILCILRDNYLFAKPEKFA
ncbi:hypothetical protein E2320_011351 [Naja naja]|nr:hypothetical protein E2320_011351 [Naja naja]